MAIMITYEDGVSDEEARLFEEAVSQARTRVREIKADLEKTWFAVAGELQLPPTEPPWFADHYKAIKSKIGGARRLAAIMEELQGYDAALGGSIWQVRQGDKAICKVGLYDPQPVAVEDGHCRAIHRIGGKEYVLDDDGIPSRRYAYCVRKEDDQGKPMLKPWEEPDTYGWKFNNQGGSAGEWNTAMAAAIQAIKDMKDHGRGGWGGLSVKAKVCLAYLNYANGGLVGLCLSSTLKRVRDNYGRAFVKAEDLTIWKVDLAKIPTTHVLINIYLRAPKQENWQIQNRKREKTGKWILQGTVKNRELFCSEVPAAATQRALSTPDLLQADNWSWKGQIVFRTI